jgi:hypothetical protein
MDILIEAGMWNVAIENKGELMDQSDQRLLEDLRERMVRRHAAC